MLVLVQINGILGAHIHAGMGQAALAAVRNPDLLGEVNAKEGNFIFIKPKSDADELVAKMKREKRILIKSYNGIGILGKCLRVSTGEKEIMQKFLSAMDDLDK